MGTTTKDYFEPCCQWKRGNYCDEIDIELCGFNSEDIKVIRKIVDKENFIISITAESPRRLQKIIEIPNENDYYDVDRIQVKLSCGNLVVKLPKKDDPNKLEISMPTLEVKKNFKELAEDMKEKISSAVDYCYSKRKCAVFWIILMVCGIFAYYCECCRVFEKLKKKSVF